MPHTSICHATRRAARLSTPSSGAVRAWVSGTPNRAGPMIATVWSIAATLAPYPHRSAAQLRPTRASATPPASATQNPIDGVAREARNETVATCARPAVSCPAPGPCPLGPAAASGMEPLTG